MGNGRNRGGYPSYSNLLYAIPLSGRSLPPEIMFSFHSMAMPMNYNVIVQTIKGQPVADAREAFAAVAQQMKCKYIFFWDEDVECPPQSVPELIYKMEQNPDIAVCGGVYCLKRKPSEPLIFRGNGNGPFWDWKAGEFFEVSGIGMGCTVVRVEALQDLKRPWFKTVSDYSRMLDGISAMESWTEDLWFCKRITDTGRWKVYVDTSLLCKHHDLNTGDVYTLPEDCKPLQKVSAYSGVKGSKSKKVLDIGSGIRQEGHYTLEGSKVITCDYDYVKLNGESDYRCDITKLPFGTNEFDIVFSAVLELFPYFETIDVLKEWSRVLKPKGELRLVLDNASAFMLSALSGQSSFDNLYYFNGKHQRKNAFTKDTIKANLIQAGFEERNIDFPPSDAGHIGVRATKS